MYTYKNKSLKIFRICSLKNVLLKYGTFPEDGLEGPKNIRGLATFNQRKEINGFRDIGFEVLDSAGYVLCDVKPCRSLEANRRFGGICRF
jgi:hypothetical protein